MRIGPLQCHGQTICAPHLQAGSGESSAPPALLLALTAEEGGQYCPPAGTNNVKQR